MRPQIRSTIFRSLFVVLVIIIFLTVKYYNCILLDFSSTPKIVLENKDKEDVILLYGGGLCGSCPQGKKLLSLKNRVNILKVDNHEQEERENERSDCNR